MPAPDQTAELPAGGAERLAELGRLMEEAPEQLQTMTQIEGETVSPQPPATADGRQIIPGEALIELMENGISGQETWMARQGVPPELLIQFHVNRAALLTSGMIDPGTRANFVRQIMAGFPGAVERFVAFTQGGMPGRSNLIVPQQHRPVLVRG